MAEINNPFSCRFARVEIIAKAYPPYGTSQSGQGWVGFGTGAAGKQSFFRAALARVETITKLLGPSAWAPALRPRARVKACRKPSHDDRRKCVRLWNTSQSGEVAGCLLSTAPVFFNVHKIRVDSDNKR